MSWRSEWSAISSRISALVTATESFMRMIAVYSEDPYGVSDKVISDEAATIFRAIGEFQDAYKDVLPEAVLSHLRSFVERWRGHFTEREPRGLNGLKIRIPLMTVLEAQISYLLADHSQLGRRASERAFLHLQRSIVADATFRDRWMSAFAAGELQCEQLGAVHLLLHGIWAFKVSAEGARTDLVFGDPLLDTTQVEQAADLLVLTEWKCIRRAAETERMAEAARVQASLYATGLLAGVELGTYRYVVLVSQHRLSLPGDVTADGITYRHVNIAVDPEAPSRAGRRTAGRNDEE